MKKFALSLALVATAALTAHAAGKPGNGNNGKSGGNNAPVSKQVNPVVVSPKPVVNPKPINIGNGNVIGNGTGNVLNKQVVNKQVVNKQVVDQQVVNKQVVNKQVVDKQVVNKQLNDNFQKNLQVLKPQVQVKDYHLHNAKQHKFGYCYQGNQHCHWTHKCWFDHYGCHCHWCPSVSCWYYWCAWDNCWYPVTYCPYGTYAF